MIEEGVEVSATPDNTQNVETPVNESEGNEGSIEQEGQEVKKQDDDFVPFPKKAVNKISRLEGQLRKRDAILYQLQKERDDLRAKHEELSKNLPKDQGPQEKDFDTYGEFLEAKTLWKVEQVQAEKQRANQEAESKNKVSAEQQKFVEQRLQTVAEKTAEMIKTTPDLKELVLEHKDFMDSLPEAVQQAFLEADEPVLAFYNMAKDGTLYDLADMTPYRAAMAIAKAQVPVQSRQTTQAPKPLRGVTGAGQSASSLSNLDKDPDALKQWMKKKGLR